MKPKPFVALNHFNRTRSHIAFLSKTAGPYIGRDELQGLSTLVTNRSSSRHRRVRQADALKRPTDRAFEGLLPTEAPTMETGLFDNFSSSSGPASPPCRI